MERSARVRGRRAATAVLAATALAAGLLGTAAAHQEPAAGTAAAVPAEDYDWRNVRIDGGGFVPSVIFNRTEPNLLYARTDIGGAYRWNDAGREWIPLLDSVGWDEWGYTGVASLATDPVDPDRVYVAVGTYTNDWDPNNGAVMRSTDRGESWDTVPLPFKLGGNMPGRGMGERLAIDPNDNRVLYLGAPSGEGLWRSTDSGATWSEVTSFPNPGNHVINPDDPWGYESDEIGVVWVTFDPDTGSPGTPTGTIYVGVADEEESVYRSTDAGATWQAVPGQPTGFLPHKGVLDEETGDLYIATSDNPGPYAGGDGEVWRLDTGSGQWTDITPHRPGDAEYGFSGLTVDRQNPGTVMVTGYSSWWPDTQIFRSTNGGDDWSPIWDWAGYPQRDRRFTLDHSSVPWLTFGNQPTAEEDSPKLGWMTEGMEIDPHDPDRMLYGTGATIYGTTELTNWDRGTRFTVRPMIKGLEETSVRDLASPPSGSAHLLSGLGDIGGFRHTDLDAVPSMMYTSPFIGTTSSLDFAGLSPNNVIRVGEHVGDSSQSTVGFSTDGGANWFAGTVPGSANGGTAAAAADGSRFLWSPADEPVHFTTTFGSSWTRSQGIPQGATIASDRVDPQRFYGFHDGTLYVSTDGGATFAAGATGGLPTEGNIRLEAAPGAAGDVWLAGGDDGSAYGLWRSTDGGLSLTRIGALEKADNIGFGRGAEGTDYHALYSSAVVDGVRGIYRSDDVGATWTRINDDDHQWAWTGGAITGDPRVAGRVYIGTNGRGIIVGETGERGNDGGPGGTTGGPGDNGGNGGDGGDDGGNGGDGGGPGDNGGTGGVDPDADCTVAYAVTGEWPGGFQGAVTVTNTGGTPVENWELRWSFPHGQTITQLWNGSHTQSGSRVSVTGASWNSRLAPGASTTIGFLGNHREQNGAPTSFTLNGTPCAGG
ncbi:xyloglucanase [Streptomyces calidiresistens]|uniref:Xyloglucanase n=1 Tax=Streptomyces calidiresistens TaxID=1485586 RepID=A0A7W3T175_9ACTN|nr:xyloglucanase [Streptomyces calidiresistens]